jgi:hypothetical protein
VNDVTFYIFSKDIYHLFSVILSLVIVFHFSISLYYGTKMIILKNKNRFGWCPEMLVTYESVLWIILFSYILITTLIGKDVIDHASFGAIFIRPVIAITSVISATLQKRRYWKAYYVYREQRLLSELEQED